MHCQRCGGMMTMEGIWTDQGKVAVARCLYCGNVVDSVVEANRARSRASLALMLEKEAEDEKKSLQEAGTVILWKSPSRRRAA